MSNSKKNRVKRCICRKDHKTYELGSIYGGLGVIIIILGAATIFVDLYATIFAATLLAISYLGTAIGNGLRGHSLLCSIRKSALDILNFITPDFLFGGV